MSDIQLFFELLKYPFMQRAIVCGIAISFCAALIGVILVLKRYSMIGHGLGEVAFASLSLALVLGLPEMYIAIPIVIIASFIILIISQKQGESGDITIALVSAGALAFGVIITAISKGFNIDVYNYMFGSILTMKLSDVIISVALSAVLILIYSIFYNRLFLITYDEKYAKVCGINVTFYQFLIALFTAIVVVIGMRMMGTLLISSLIVFPAVIARKLTKSFKGMSIMSIAISILCFIFGLIISTLLNLPTGASIVIVYIVVLLFTLVWKKIVK